LHLLELKNEKIKFWQHLVFFCAGNDQLRIHRSLSIDFICIFVPYGQICGKSNSEPAGDQLTEQ
jgi:hypothetical protein